MDATPLAIVDPSSGLRLHLAVEDRRMQTFRESLAASDGTKGEVVGVVPSPWRFKQAEDRGPDRNPVRRDGGIAAGRAGQSSARNRSICAGLILQSRLLHSSAKLCKIVFVMFLLFGFMFSASFFRPAPEPCRSARFQKKHQQPVGIAGHGADNITSEKPLLADAFDSAPKRLHLQPVSCLFQRICPGGGKAAVPLPRLIAS